jgi:hypothetical protein
MSRCLTVLCVSSSIVIAACSQQSGAPDGSASALADVPAAAKADGKPSGKAAESVSVNRMDCLAPVHVGDSYQSLAVAYGNNAQLGMVPGAEGTESRGLLLYATVPARKVYVTFWDAAMRHVSRIEPADGAVAWTGPEGIHVGSTLDYIEKVNGKPFTISGFGWDYGGYAADFKGGRLERLSGGCSISLRFYSDSLPEGVSGDGVMVESNDPRLSDAKVKVVEMSFGWPLPAGITPAE